MDASRQERVRLDARALLALGWVPSLDEPGRLYPLQADMPSVRVEVFVWSVMLELYFERRHMRRAGQ